jgi:hypothetical protein
LESVYTRKGIEGSNPSLSAFAHRIRLWRRRWASLFWVIVVKNSSKLKFDTRKSSPRIDAQNLENQSIVLLRLFCFLQSLTVLEQVFSASFFRQKFTHCGG